MSKKGTVLYSFQNDDWVSETKKWSSYDSEFIFNSNWAYRRKEMEEHGYGKDDIDYTHNSHGFRCEEFSKAESILFLGCSNAYGTGLPIEETWTYKVAQRMGMPYYNLGRNGAAADTCYRLLKENIKYLNPKYIIFRVPYFDRIEIIIDGAYHVLAHWYIDSERNGTITPELQEYWKFWYKNKENRIINRQRNIDAVSYIAAEVGANLFSVADEDMITAIYKDGYQDKSRDLVHVGGESNSAWADMIVKHLT